jgi:hypothetical protein
VAQALWRYEPYLTIVVVVGGLLTTVLTMSAIALR